jgi:hypothetical protein
MDGWYNIQETATCISSKAINFQDASVWFTLRQSQRRSKVSSYHYLETPLVCALQVSCKIPAQQQWWNNHRSLWVKVEHKCLRVHHWNLQSSIKATQECSCSGDIMEKCLAMLIS